MISCSPGFCLDETEARVKATFYSKETGLPHAPDSVTLYGLNMDTLRIYSSAQNLSSAEMPLSAADNGCVLVIEINGILDTLVFRYTSAPHFLSKECGYTFYYTLDTAFYSVNIIDSLSFVKNTITTLNEENIRIFY